MKEISPGSIVIGKSGRKLVVDKIEGDILYSGGLKILASAVVMVIPTTRFNLGDRVRYVGNVDYLQTQYAGSLTIVSYERGVYTCSKPNGRYTSWIEKSDLALEVIDR